MPGAFRPLLHPGDGILFNSISIHRGRYHADKLRRTLMIDFVKTRVAEEDFKTKGLNQYTDQVRPAPRKQPSARLSFCCTPLSL